MQLVQQRTYMVTQADQEVSPLLKVKVNKSGAITTYAVPGDHTSQVCAYSIQTVLLNLLVLCHNQVCGISLQQHAFISNKTKQQLPAAPCFRVIFCRLCEETSCERLITLSP